MKGGTNIDTEIRYNDTNIRILSVYDDGGGKINIRITWDRTTYKTYPQLVREWGIREVVLINATYEKRYYGLTVDEAKKRVKQWRRAAVKAGLIIVKRTNMWRTQ